MAACPYASVLTQCPFHLGVVEAKEQQVRVFGLGIGDYEQHEASAALHISAPEVARALHWLGE